MNQESSLWDPMMLQANLIVVFALSRFQLESYFIAKVTSGL